MRFASRACFALATAIGLVLAWHGGWPILIAGIAAAAAAMGYSGGPRPISYTPFGDFVVWLFFGLVAVGGTYYLQTGSLSSGALIAATMVGFPATAVLVVNNYRDLDPDAQVGKRTLAVCLGRAFSRWEYAVLMLGPFVLLAVLASQTRIGASLLLPLLSLPMAVGLVRRFWRERQARHSTHCSREPPSSRCCSRRCCASRSCSADRRDTARGAAHPAGAMAAGRPPRAQGPDAVVHRASTGRWP